MFLKPGDTIGIAAPARKISKQELQKSIEIIEENGYKVFLSPNLFNQNNQFSGTDLERASDFNLLLNNPEVKAILCARGGYGSLRIIDLINWNLFNNNPKIIAGFSDITVLHSHINLALNQQSLHSTMPINMAKTDNPFQEINNKSFFNALAGKKISYTLGSSILNTSAFIEGKLIGGNLSVLYSMMGSKSFEINEDVILFIEDLDEYLYHIDRMMMGLSRMKGAENINAILVGSFTEMKDNTIPFGKSANEIIAEHAQRLKIPIIFNFPAGHDQLNQAFFLGKKARINDLVFEQNY